MKNNRVKPKRVLNFALLLFAFSFSLFALAVPAAHAQLVPSSCKGLDCTFDDLIQLLVNIYNYALGLAAFVVMAFIVFGGIRLVIWAMMENPQEELLAGKRTVLRAIVGFIIILTAYLTVNTVLTLLGIHESSQVGMLLKRFGF